MMSIRELIQYGKSNRVRGIRDIEEFFNWNFCHLQDETVSAAKAERAKYESTWVAHLEILRLIAAGRLAIEKEESTWKHWRAWMGKNLRDISPEDYVADHAIPFAEDMLARIKKLGTILKRLEKIEAKSKTLVPGRE